MILVNAYFKYSDQIEIHLNNLETVSNRFRGEQILVAADANARSVLWFNESTDDRGEELEALLLAYDMILFNSPGEVSTYENTRGQTSNIDRRISNWRVHGEVSISDHKLITFYLNVTQGQICYQGSRAEAVSYTHLDVYKRQTQGY